MRYSIEPKDRAYVKGYRSLSFVKNTGKNLIIQKPLEVYGNITEMSQC